MPAPINTGDFWLTQSPVPPHDDPNYTYPAEVLSRSPLCFFRLEGPFGHGLPAVDETGNTITATYSGNTAETDGITVCDCKKGMNNALQDNSGLFLEGLQVVTIVDLTVIFAVEMETLDAQNFLWHIGDTVSTNNHGLRIICEATGHISFSWTNGGAQTAQTANPVLAIGEAAVLGFTLSDAQCLVYKNGALFDTVAFAPGVLNPATHYGRGALGGYRQSTSTVWGVCDAAMLDEFSMFNAQLNAAAHLEIYNSMRKVCTTPGNCDWTLDPDWDTNNAVKAPGEIQAGDFWIVEGP